MAKIKQFILKVGEGIWKSVEMGWYPFFLFLLLPQMGFSQTDTLVQTDIFKVLYSEKLESPLWVEYKVLCPNGQADRGSMDFWEVEGIHTSDDEDYKGNVWDKGHMAPASAFSCSKEMLKKTFSYLNSALQHQSLNRGVWNRLEGFEKDLANFYEVEVRIEVIFSEDSEVLPTGATIPIGFKKVIKWGEQSANFYFPNEEIRGKRWIDFKID